MAHCTQCGSTIADDAAFCASCGAASVTVVASQTPASAPARPGGKAPLLVAIAVLVVVLLAGGGWFLKGYLDDRATEKRARAQAEVAADFVEGAFISYDSRLVAKSVSRDYADRVDEVVEGSEDDGAKVNRKWDGDVLVLSVRDADNPYEVLIEADGDKESAEVTLDVSGEGETDQSLFMTVELDGSRWIVVEFNGSSIASMFGDEESSDGSSSGDSEERSCQANQRTIEGAVQQYLAADEYNSIDDISGALDSSNYLISDYIKDVPHCPSDETPTYYIYDDGTTDCAAGVHDHF
ncbi:MAG: zinc ribbon domain-containing protein [Actinobacteria bacterium]|nr:MAG: zinc ribbon domain-containing protein [Actinomycetota bacterium]